MIYKILFFLLIGYIILGLHYYCFSIRNLNKDKKIIKKIISWLIQTLHEWLVWEYIVILFLMNYQQLFFSMLLSFFFPSLKSHSGNINFFSALVYCFINFIVLSYFCFLIHKKYLENKKIKHDIPANQIKNIELFSLEKFSDVRKVKFTDNLKESKENMNSSKKKQFFDLNLKQINDQIGQDVLPKSDNTEENSILDGGFTKTYIDDRNSLDKAVKKEKISENNVRQNKIISVSPYPSKFKKDFNENIYKRKNPHEKKISRNIHFQILFKGYKFNTFLQRYFLILDFIRQSLFVLFVLVLPKQPFFQIFCINIIQFCFLLTAFFVEPFEKKVFSVNFIGTEIFITSILINCLLIGIYDIEELQNIEDRIAIGTAIIICNFCFRLWTFVMVVAIFIFDYFEAKKNKINPSEI